METREIRIAGPNEKLAVKVEPQTNVAQIKSMLAKKLAIPDYRQRLLLDGQELRDGQTVLETRMWRSMGLKLEVDTRGPMITLDVLVEKESRIFTKLGQVQARTLDTIKRVKVAIFFTLGFYPEKLHLSGPSSRDLADDGTLEALLPLRMQPSLEIYCAGKLLTETAISISHLSRFKVYKTHPIKIRSSETVESLKLKIEFQSDIPVHRQTLVIADHVGREIELADDEKLVNYMIWNYDVVELRTAAD